MLNSKVRNSILGLIALLFLGGTITYWHYAERHPSTDDAYINAHRVELAPEISGTVADVLVHNNQMVHQGDVIFSINPDNYQIAVNKAEADYQLATQNMHANQQGVLTANANVDSAKSALMLVQHNAKRVLSLVKQGRASKAEGDQMHSNIKTAKANLNAALSKKQQAVQGLGDIGNSNADIRRAKAALDLAQLNLRRTKVRASISGKISHFNLQPGDNVTPAMSSLTIVSQSNWWVDANFKETKLRFIKPQQQALISVDTYPGITFHGIIESISPGTGSAFSLFPPENATGNWVKVTQRIPVKIIITDPKKNYPLHLGMSASVSIDAQG